MTDDPHALFDSWAAEARESELNDSNAMALATTTADYQPSVRMVLLKGHDERGFVWYTNLESRKAEELLATKKAALLFHWKSLRRQVRIEGPVSRVSDAEGDAAAHRILGRWRASPAPSPIVHPYRIGLGSRPALSLTI